MQRLTQEALAHFESHHGIASIAQLEQCGVSRGSVHALQRDGVLELVLHGAYRLRGQPLTENGRRVAVCVAHPGHVLAGPTAGRVLGFRKMPNDLRIHTLSPPRSNPTRSAWVVPYRTAAFHASDVITRTDGIVHTSSARTALDSARFLADPELLSVIEQAMSDGKLTIEAMYAVAVEWESPRRRWLRRYLDLLDTRLLGGAADSDAEVLLGDALAKGGIADLLRQFEIELPGYGAARFDLAVPRLRWAIEVDLFPTHQETTGRFADERRDAAAHSIGWVTTRVGPEKFGAAFSSTVDGLLATYRRFLAAG